MTTKPVPPTFPGGSKSLRGHQQQFDFNFTEGQHRRVLMADCETECSQILENLYVAGATVAADLHELQKNGITHIVNCSADVVEDYFIHLPEFNYLSLNMVDGRYDDVSWFLGDVIHFVDAAHKNGHKVLIHCERGVSRSCSFAIAYTMWIRGMDISAQPSPTYLRYLIAKYLKRSRLYGCFIRTSNIASHRAVVPHLPLPSPFEPINHPRQASRGPILSTTSSPSDPAALQIPPSRAT